MKDVIIVQFMDFATLVVDGNMGKGWVEKLSEQIINYLDEQSENPVTVSINPENKSDDGYETWGDIIFDEENCKIHSSIIITQGFYNS